MTTSNVRTFRGRAAATTPPGTQLAVAPSAPLVSTRAQDQATDMEMAVSLAKSDLVPRAFKNKAENILIAIGLGRALGLGAAPSLYALHVIEGTPSPSAKTQQALVRRAGHKFRTLESSSEKARVQIVRVDDPEYPTEVTYTVADAAAAGLLDHWAERWGKNDEGRNQKQIWTLPGNLDIDATEDELKKAGAPAWVKPSMIKRRDNWYSNRAAMLHARATTACVGQACSEVLSGLDFELAGVIDVEAWDTDPNTPTEAEPTTETVDEKPAETQTTEKPDVVDAEVIEDAGQLDLAASEPAPSGDTDWPDIDAAKIHIKAVGITQAAFLKRGREIAAENSWGAPTSFEGIFDTADGTGHDALTEALFAWVEQVAQERAAEEAQS